VSSVISSTISAMSPISSLEVRPRGLVATAALRVRLPSEVADLVARDATARLGLGGGAAGQVALGDALDARAQRRRVVLAQRLQLRADAADAALDLGRDDQRHGEAQDDRQDQRAEDQRAARAVGVVDRGVGGLGLVVARAGHGDRGVVDRLDRRLELLGELGALNGRDARLQDGGQRRVVQLDVVDDLVGLRLDLARRLGQRGQHDRLQRLLVLLDVRQDGLLARVRGELLRVAGGLGDGQVVGQALVGQVLRQRAAVEGGGRRRVGVVVQVGALVLDIPETADGQEGDDGGQDDQEQGAREELGADGETQGAHGYDLVGERSATAPQ
jgi:hypothetical protein